MQGKAYLVIEVADLKMPGIVFSAGHPECTLDVVSVPTAPGGSTLAVLVLARGAKAAWPELLAELQAAFPTMRALERDPNDDALLLTFTLPARARTDPVAIKIHEFLVAHAIPVRWQRIEQGRCFIKAEVPADVAPHVLRDRCAGYFEALHIEAEVDLEASGAGDFGLWNDLVQATLVASKPK